MVRMKMEDSANSSLVMTFSVSFAGNFRCCRRFFVNDDWLYSLFPFALFNF